MNPNLRFVLGVISGFTLAFVPVAVIHLHAAGRNWHTLGKQGHDTSPARAHTEEKFSFTANAPFDRVFPLFGADRERVWAPGWNPEFIHPLPATDVAGMVFTVAHGHLQSAWVNTQFDREQGRVQYVYTIPDHLVTVITLNVKPNGNQTQVEVKYDRTSLTPDGDERVQEMAKYDRSAGPEWEQQIDTWLAKQAGPM